MNAIGRFRLLKLVGEIMSNPDAFNHHVDLKIDENTDERVAGRFVLTGPLADFAREFKTNVQGKMETKTVIENNAGREGTD